MIISQIIVNSIIASSFYLLISLGFNLQYSVVKFFNLSFGSIILVGAYGFLFFAKFLGLPLIFALHTSLIVASIVGFLSEKFVFLPLRERHASNLSLLISSLGISISLEALFALLFTSRVQTYGFTKNQMVLNVLGASITSLQLFLILFSLALFALLLLILKKTRFGKAVRAIADDEEVSRIIGINTSSIIGFIFIPSSAIAALTGIFIGFDTGFSPTLGFPLLLKGVIAAIVGGMGNVPGSLLGAFFLGFSENFGVMFLSSAWKDAIAFMVLIMFLVIRFGRVLRF